MLWEEGTNASCLTFYIPKNCPSDKPLECLNSSVLPEALTPQKQNPTSMGLSDLHVTEPPREGVRRQNQLERFSAKREHNQHT
jgi:hypothetical protein